MTGRPSIFTSQAPRDHSGDFSIVETPGDVVISGRGYRLRVSRRKPAANLDLNGRQIAALNLASGLDTLEAADEQTNLGAPVVRRTEGGCTLAWSGSSALWPRKTVTLHAWSGGFNYGYDVQGSGEIDRAYLLRTRQTASPAAEDLRLFNAEPNSGCVRYTGDKCSLDKFCLLCYPEKATEEFRYTGPNDFWTISVGRDRYFHDGNWLFTPAPFCYAVEGEGNWLTMGIAALPGEWMFTDMEYPGDGFGFALAYDGHVRVDGEWSSPRLVCTTAPDEYSAVQQYCDSLRNSGTFPNHGRGPVHDWWLQPIFCGWGEQVSQERHEGGKGMAANWATQPNYERWLTTLEAHDINPGTVVIDDKWQGSYGLNDVDTAKWPDMQGFIAGQHRKARKVLLWLNAWSGQGLPPDECMLDADGVSLRVDPGNLAFRERFAAEVRYMLRDLDADGFKIDFTHLIPRGRASKSAGGLWGLELMRQWFVLISDAAREAKPDAVLIAHAANPYLADMIDVLRLNDVAGLIDPYASVLPDMRHRARIARAASPYWLLEADNWPTTTRQQWREYVRAQATGEFGIPSLYHAERLGWGPTDEPLDEEDYRAIRESWATYRATLAQE